MNRFETLLSIAKGRRRASPSTEDAAGSNVAFDLVFKGTRSDTIVWALGFAPGSFSNRVSF